MADGLVTEDPCDHRPEQQDHRGERQQREAQAGLRASSRSGSMCGFAAEPPHDFDHLSYLVNYSL